MYVCMYIYIYIYTYTHNGEVLLRGVGTVRYLLILSENSACQVPTCAVAAGRFDNPRRQVVPRSQIPRSTSHDIL